MKRIIKITSVSLISLVAFLLSAAVIVFVVVLTPNRVTPVVERATGKFINAKIKVESVNVTFLSTFPQLGVELKNGILISKVFRDSDFQKQDTLIKFDNITVSVDVWRYIKKKRLRLNDVKIENANICIYIDSSGKANYDIAKPSADTVADIDTSLLFRSVSIKNLSIEKSNIIYQDDGGKIYANIDSLNTHAKIRLSEKRAKINLELSNKKVYFSFDGKPLVKGVSIGFKTDINARFDSSLYRLENAVMRINKTGLKVVGTFLYDTANGDVNMDASVGLRTQSLKDALELIPQSIIASKGVEADGKVGIKGHIRGTYGKRTVTEKNGKQHKKVIFPEVELTLKIKNGRAHYDGMPYGIDTLSVNFTGFVDMNKIKESFADLKILRLKAQAADIDLLAQCKVRHILTKPSITLKTSANIDLAKISKVIMLPDGIAMNGRVKTSIESAFDLKDILNGNYGRIKAKGNLALDRISYSDSSAGIQAKANGSVRLKGGKYFGALANLKKISFKGMGIRAFADSLTMRTFTENTAADETRDTSKIVRMGASISWQKLFMRIDTVSVFNLRGKVSARIRPQKENPHKAEIKVKFNTDTLAARAGKIRAYIEHAELDFGLQHVRDTIWKPDGNVEVNRVTLNMPQYGLPVTLRTLKANIHEDTLRLERASLRMGRSNITLSGRVDRLMRTLRRGRRIRAQIDIKSRRIDCNQLLNALSSPSDTTSLKGDASDDIASFSNVSVASEADTLLPADTLQGLTVFKVPRKLNLLVTLDVRKVFYDKLVFENIKGAIEVKNQTVNLKKLSLRTMDADMKISMVYAAPTTKLANVGFDMGIRGIKIENLTKFISSLDSAMPMLRSFQGNVDVDVTASGALDSVMSIILPSLTAALYLHGENLVLLDGETFAQIAKMLMFKNKQRNMIDSLSTSITIKDGEINVFPFTVQMDRYRVAVGGRQDLDMNLNYHISVLKSPVPFKLGINIRGTLNHPKYGLGKALYKNADSPAEIRHIDTTRLNLGKQIIEQFEGWIESQKGFIHTPRNGFGLRSRRSAIADTVNAFEYVFDSVSGGFINPKTGEKYDITAQ